MQPVKMYTTAVCPYCVRAKQILKSKGVEQIEEIRVDLDPEARTHMMEITGRRTVPQIFIGTTHVGGHDDLVALGDEFLHRFRCCGHAEFTCQPFGGNSDLHGLPFCKWLNDKFKNYRDSERPCEA